MKLTTIRVALPSMEVEAPANCLPNSAAAATVVGKGLSVRQTEAMVRNLLASKDQPAPPRQIDPNIRQLQDDLSARLGARVQIQHSAKGKGKLVLAYNSLDELDGILSHIK